MITVQILVKCISVNFTCSTTSRIVSIPSAEHQQGVTTSAALTQLRPDPCPFPTSHTAASPQQPQLHPLPPLAQTAPFPDIALGVLNPTLPSPACSHSPASRPSANPEGLPQHRPASGWPLTHSPAPLRAGGPGRAPLPPAPARRPRSPSPPAQRGSLRLPVLPGAAVPSRKGSGCSRAPPAPFPGPRLQRETRPGGRGRARPCEGRRRGAGGSRNLRSLRPGRGTGRVSPNRERGTSPAADTSVLYKPITNLLENGRAGSN